MPDGVFWWAVGTMPFAVLLRSHVLMLFTLVLAFIWLCVELQAQFYPAAFPVFVAAAVYVLAEQRTKTTLFLLTVLTTVVWVEVSVGTWWHSNRWPRVYVDHVYVTVGLAVLVFGFGQFLSARNDERWRAYGAALRFWTIRLALVVLLLMSFEDPWRALISSACVTSIATGRWSPFRWQLASHSPGWQNGRRYDVGGHRAGQPDVCCHEYI